MAVLLVPIAAHATVDELVAGALKLQAQGKAADAYARLKPAEITRAGDPDFDYALGLAAADSGHRGDAIVALQRVLAVQPGNAQARAEIARVYAMAGDIDTARAEFNTVVDDPSIPDPVRQRFNALVRNYDRAIAGGGRDVSGFAELEGGYDSNVNSATNLTSLTLPVFAFLGPAQLGGSASRIGKGFGQAQGGVSWQAGLSRQTRAYVSVLGIYRDAFGLREFDQAAVTGTGGVAHTLADRNVVSLSGQVQHFWLGRASYRTSYGAIGQYTKRLADGRALSLNAQYTYLDYRTDDLRDADRFAGTLAYAGSAVFVSLGGGVETTRRSEARHLSFGFAQSGLSLAQPVSPGLAVTAAASAEYHDYRLQDPLFLRGRTDVQLDVSAGLRIAIDRRVTVRPRVTYTRNASNLDLYDYQRVTAAVALRGEF